ncbi:hypothetical protein ABTE83_19555, partial [Acinetobacter baumannii]
VDQKALADWQKLLDERKLSRETRQEIAAEAKAHRGGYLDYAKLYWNDWLKYLWGSGFFILTVVEAFCAMLIGIALWKWGVIQGQRSALFYA